MKQIDRNAFLTTLLVVIVLTGSIVIIAPIFASFATFISFVFKFIAGCFITSSILNLYNYFAKNGK